MAINRYIYISALKPANFIDYRYRVSYSRLEKVSSVDDLEHPVVRSVLKHFKVTDALDINVIADLPASSGLGSSSAFTVTFQAAVVMIVVAFIAFLLFQYVGDPVVFLLGQDAKPEQVRELRAALGLDQPFFVQFWHFLVNAAQGEFGLSLRQGAKVSRLIGERFPATLELALVAAVLALFVGIPMGVYTALRHGTFMSQVFMTVSLLGVSLPTFLIGILLILVFAVTLGWFPSFGRGETVKLGWWTSGLFSADGWQHIVLPAVTLAIFQLTLIMRLVRAEMLEVLRTDYIKFARAGPRRTAPSISATRSRTRWCP